MDRLPTAKQLGLSASKRVHFVKTSKELNTLISQLTQNAKYIGKRYNTMKIKKTQKIEQVEVDLYMLDDGTQINIRFNSQTGGKSIDIDRKYKTIHNLETLRK
ncbi:hypothetical protein CCZ01_07630 [Helicobacter monodelphidis]|uniref:hypothetical protein n=1 Tax=Helicobacter sp. 15-1451 TaxID=2004995 RepID=UPI000DCD861F|nr:hypothetical protein [Helicobacter sp. 15-1451]RAX57029.1 hypothetical protein CCZ01_07630 [Helicobacter sp. 15-1451]